MTMHLRGIDSATLAATGGLGLNLLGSLSADQIASFVGTGLAVGGAAVSWYLSQRARVADADLRRDAEARESRRQQDLLDFEQRLTLRTEPPAPPPGYVPDTRSSG